jgi:hypothetical protein
MFHQYEPELNSVERFSATTPNIKFNGNSMFDDKIWRQTGTASELFVHFTHICAKGKRAKIHHEDKQRIQQNDIRGMIEVLYYRRNSVSGFRIYELISILGFCNLTYTVKLMWTPMLHKIYFLSMPYDKMV